MRWRMVRIVRCSTPISTQAAIRMRAMRSAVVAALPRPAHQAVARSTRFSFMRTPCVFFAGAVQGGEEGLAPPVHVLRADAVEQRRMALLPLGQRSEEHT